MEYLFFVLFLMGVGLTIFYLFKAVKTKQKYLLKKSGISVLLIISSLIMIGIAAPDTEEYLAEEDTEETESIEQEKSEEATQEKEEKEAKEIAEQKALEEEEQQQAKEMAEQEAQEKEEERIAKEKAEEEAQKVEERLAEEKAEERIAKEKAEEEAQKVEERLAEEKAEKERQAKDKAELEAKEKDEREELFAGYRLIKVDGGNLSGHREAKVAVDIGFGDREYWAFTNEHGQLVRVVADEIILQNDDTEPVKSSGRYYHDEAKVPGTESSNLDEGHVIADSLGGVANAYNITPQNSTMNRHGDQAYMERNISQAGGATNFEAIITYPDTNTQIPNKYKFNYIIRGNSVVDEFENVNPDEYNKEQGVTESKSEPKEEVKSEPKEKSKPEPKEEGPAQDVSKVDENGNGTVTIGEAEAAGYSMPIKEGHWLYPYMIDRDGDGMVGE